MTAAAIELDIYVEVDDDPTDVDLPPSVGLDLADEDHETPICSASVDLALTIADACALVGKWEESKAWLNYAERQSRWPRR